MQQRSLPNGWQSFKLASRFFPRACMNPTVLAPRPLNVTETVDRTLSTSTDLKKESTVLVHVYRNTEYSLLQYFKNNTEERVVMPAPGASLKGAQAYLSRWGLAQPKPRTLH
eukprot:COSAG03_NODE_67_length_15062_cov_86.408781_11_plen_112_part_00